MRNKNLKIFNDYLQYLLRKEMLVLRKEIEKEHYDWKIIRNAIYNDCRFFETDSNLFNLVKYHNIETPEALESFLESCQNANMQEMVSDFSLNNHPKLWHDFIDYVLYDYNNLTALWEEIKEYNKLKYYC